MKLLDVYPLFDIEPVKGEGAYVYDKNGTKYLDFYGGHAVISIGHSHPEYVKAIKDQAEKLIFYSNSVINSLQQEVADRIQKAGGLENYKLFMINSGAEAIENAVKMASFSNKKTRFIALEGGFHGRTAAAISLTHKMAHRTSFDLDSTITFIPINDSERLEKELSKEDVCAVIAEPIQGIAGIHLCNDNFLKSIASLTKKHGAFFIADEIQCGFGRSGKFFAHQYSGVEPDIITMAKGMGNGFPVGGILVKDHVIHEEYGMAGTTFGGNHLACRAVIAVLDVMKKENLINRARIAGSYLMDALQSIPQIKEVRGRGLMIGIEMNSPIKDFRYALLKDRHIFTGSSSNPNVIRLLPPMCINEEQCDHFLTSFKSLL
jgi:acetylornithine aminotransferase